MRARTTPAAKKAAVNFDCNARPRAKPSAISQRLSPVRQSSTRAREPKRPKHDQRRIGTDEHRADRDERHGEPHERRERGLFRRAKQAPRDEGDKSGHRANDEERKRPHSEFRAAEQRSRAADEEGDHRRVVEISERKGARPKRVIGFVEGELEPPSGQRLQGQKSDRRCAGIKTE